MLQAYLEELRRLELLQPDEENALWERAAQGDCQAHRVLMTAYQPLVFKVAMSFGLPETDTLELIQEGMVGLLEASETYDHRRGVAFSLFASYRIRGCMLDFLKKSAATGMLYLEGETLEGTTLAETLAAAQASPAELAESHLLYDKVTQALERLPVKEKQVLTGIFLEDKTAQAIACALDVSLGHVYRLQKQGVRRIRGMLSRFMHEFNKN